MGRMPGRDDADKGGGVDGLSVVISDAGALIDTESK